MDINEKWNEIEDKWYSLLDRLEERGIPIYKIVDPIEERGIPTLPLFIGLLVILLLGLVWLLSGTGVAPQGGTLELSVLAGNKSLQGASVSVSLGDRPLGVWTTDQNGKLTVNIPGTGNVKIEVTKSNCEKIEKALDFTGGILSISLKTVCSGAETESCLNIPEEINSVPLQGANGQAQKNCKVYLVKPDGTTEELDWSVVNGQLIIGKGDCITKDEMIRISCEGYSGEYYPDEIFDFAEAGESLQLKPTSPEFSGDSDGNGVPDWEQDENEWSGTDWGDQWGTESDDVDDNGNGIPDSAEQDMAEQQQEGYTTLSVSVYDKDTGAPLSGIEVKAVDGNGTLLPGNQTDVISENGLATLKVPKQTLSLQAIDPNNVYGTLTTPPFYPTGFATLSLTKGWPTTIWVRQPDGRGIPSARVTINNIKLFTDSQGKAVVALSYGERYDVYAYKDGYKPAMGSVAGGSSINITLEKLVDNNSAPLTIEILNPTRMDDPFPNVKVKLVTKDGLLTGECTTPANGRCSWSRVYATTYNVLAKPPLAYEYINVGTFELKPGLPVLKSFEVEPVKMPIRVRTLVDDKPTEKVKLTLYRTYPDVERVDQTTSKNSYGEFNAYWGNEYYITGEWHNRSVKLYGTIGPFKLTSSKNFVMNLEKPETGIDLNIQRTAKLGSRVYGELSVGLPYMDEKRKITYKQVIIEIWSGDPGDKLDPKTSPILIDKVPELVRMSETSQIPKIGVVGYSSYSSDFGGKTNPAVDTSKGIKITITNYKPGNFQIKLPFLVRKGALSNNCTIHYRAVYVSSESKFSTDWGEKVVKITGKSDWHNIPGGDFYLFKSGLTLTPDDKNWQKQITATVESIAYLHITALSRDYSDTGRVSFEINPKKMEPLYYWGTITNANNTKTWKIEKTELHGNSFDVMKSTLKRKLEPDDKVEVTIAIKADENGTAEILPFYREYSQEGNPLILIVNIKNTSWTPTPIPNVAGNVTGYVHFTKDNIPSGYSGKDYWGEFYDNLPLFSKNQSIAREFKLVLALKNTGSQSYNSHLEVEGTSDLNLDYPSNIVIPTGVSNFQVTGTGPDEPAQGEINIWVWQDTKPEKPWVTIKFEPNDYYIILTTNNTVNEKSKDIRDIVTKFTSSGYIQAKDDKSKVFKLTLAKFGETQGTKKYYKNSVAYYFTAGNLQPGSKVDVETKSDMFDLLKKFTVQGAALNPKPQAFNPVVLTSKRPVVGRIAIINYWDKDLSIQPQLYDMDTGKPIGSGLGPHSISSKYYNVTLYATKFDKNGKIIPPKTISHGTLKLGPGERAIIFWATSAMGSAANDYTLNMKLSLRLESHGITETANYSQKVSANLPIEGNQGTIEGDYTAGNYTVTRSITAPNSIDYTTDCQADIKDNMLKDAEVCDATQITYLIKKMIDKLKDSDEKAIAGGPYAIGNDKLSLKEISKIIHSSTKINRLVVADETAGGTKDELSCGVFNLVIIRNKDKSYDIQARLNSRMPWCYPGQPSFFIGLINPDSSLSGSETVTVPYSFEEGASDFEDILSDVMGSEDKTAMIWGYTKTPHSQSLSKNDYYTIKWTKLKVSDIGQQSEYQWIKKEMGNHKIVGFLRWYPPTSVSSTGLTEAYLMGVLASNDMSDENTIKNMERCFIANLALHWITGNSSYINETNITKGIIIPLDECKMPNMDTVIKIPEYSFDIYNETGANITGNWTNTTSIWIKATGDSNISYCYIGVEQLDTSKEILWKEMSEGYYKIDNNLKEGENTILLKCIGNNSLAGPVVKKKVYIDTKPPIIRGKKTISIVLGRNECCKNAEYEVSDDGSGLDRCWVELGKDTSNGVIYEEKQIGGCKISELETSGNYNVTCGIGSNRLSEDLPNWVSSGSTCVDLPQIITAGIICEDKVGNIGNIPIHVHFSGSDISIEPVTSENTCPTLLTSGDIVEDNCLFNPASVDKTESIPIYYTNTDKEVTLKFNVKASTPSVSCILTIKGDTLFKTYTSPSIEGDVTSEYGAVYTYKVDMSKIGEGKYNVTLQCSAEGEGTTTGYDYIGTGCDVGSDYKVWDSSTDANCKTECIVEESSSQGETTNGGGYGCLARCSTNENCAAYCQSWAQQHGYSNSKGVCTHGCCSCII